jgi:hypothetical protein
MQLVEMFKKETEDVVSQIYVALWVSGRLFLLGAIIYLLFSVGVNLVSHIGEEQRERKGDRDESAEKIFGSKREVTEEEKSKNLKL